MRMHVSHWMISIRVGIGIGISVRIGICISVGIGVGSIVCTVRTRIKRTGK